MTAVVVNGQPPIRLTLVQVPGVGPPGAGAGSTALNDLTDVTSLVPAVGHVIRWSGAAWVNVAGTTYFDAAGAAATAQTAAASDATTKANAAQAAATAAAATDATTKANAAQAAAIAATIASSDIDTAVVLTQAAYDALSPPNARTLYVVIG